MVMAENGPGEEGGRDAVEWAVAGRDDLAGDDAPQPGSAARTHREAAEMTSLFSGLRPVHPMA
jgi:hypothetical protein